MIGCPDINDSAGKITVYLRNIQKDENGNNVLKIAAELDGIKSGMKLGTPDSLRNSLQITENTDSLHGLHHLHIV